MGFSDADATVSRSFRLWERTSLETSFVTYNVFNHQGVGGPNTSVTSSTFGESTGGNNSTQRGINLQGLLRF